MIAIQPIYGLSVGMEYVDDEEIGFAVNIDLFFFRITWYRDLRYDE